MDVDLSVLHDDLYKASRPSSEVIPRSKVYAQPLYLPESTHPPSKIHVPFGNMKKPSSPTFRGITQKPKGDFFKPKPENKKTFSTILIEPSQTGAVTRVPMTSSKRERISTRPMVPVFKPKPRLVLTPSQNIHVKGSKLHSPPADRLMLPKFEKPTQTASNASNQRSHVTVPATPYMVAIAEAKPDVIGGKATFQNGKAVVSNVMRLSKKPEILKLNTEKNEAFPSYAEESRKIKNRVLALKSKAIDSFDLSPSSSDKNLSETLSRIEKQTKDMNAGKIFHSPADTPKRKMPAYVPETISGLSSRVKFAKGKSEPGQVATEEIIHFAKMARGALKNKDTIVSLKAYAQGSKSEESKARRLSLSRALNVRKVLVKHGVPNTQIQLKALGSSSGSGEKNRVDLTLKKK